MEPDVVVQLLAQGGLAAVLLYLLLEERKARKALEDRVFGYLDDEREETRGMIEEVTKPGRPDGLTARAAAAKR